MIRSCSSFVHLLTIAVSTQHPGGDGGGNADDVTLRAVLLEMREMHATLRTVVRSEIERAEIKSGTTLLQFQVALESVKENVAG